MHEHSSTAAERFLAYLAVGLVPGVTMTDRLLTAATSVGLSLGVFVLTELVRPWVRHHAKRLAPVSMRPAKPDDEEPGTPTDDGAP